MTSPSGEDNSLEEYSSFRGISPLNQSFRARVKKALNITDAAFNPDGSMNRVNVSREIMDTEIKHGRGSAEKLGIKKIKEIGNAATEKTRGFWESLLPHFKPTQQQQVAVHPY